MFLFQKCISNDLFHEKIEMHSDVREKFLNEGVLFPVNVLGEEETKFNQLKYKEYVKKYGSAGE